MKPLRVQLQVQLMFNGHAPRKWNKRNRRLRRLVEHDSDNNIITVTVTDKPVTTVAYSWPKCKHWRVPIDVGPYRILASGSFNSPQKGLPGEKPWPARGLYLDAMWTRDLGGMSSAGIECPVDPWWPYIVVDWSDRAAIDDEWYELLVDTAIGWLEGGTVPVEIACQGGHGRTGTMIAGILAKLEGLSAADAIDTLRKRYCEDAVESWSQKCQIYRFLGEEPPPKPEIVTPVVTTGSYWPNTSGAVEKLGGAIGAIVKQTAPYSDHHYSYYGKGFDQEECYCSHSRTEHWNGGRGECKLCSALPLMMGGGRCRSFRLLKAGKAAYKQHPTYKGQ